LEDGIIEREREREARERMEGKEKCSGFKCSQAVVTPFFW
jgi:hypothetical protein